VATVTTTAQRRTARRALDERLQPLHQDLSDLATPRAGWIRAIREALGMPPAVLAARLGIDRTSLVRLEQSERAGRIRFDSLRRAADALGCDLAYVLIPRQPLEQTVRERAVSQAVRLIGEVDHIMALENQRVSAGRREDLVNDLAEDLVRTNRIRWDD
jgi:predicted DNA-binding mobile mystery protein A